MPSRPRVCCLFVSISLCVLALTRLAEANDDTRTVLATRVLELCPTFTCDTEHVRWLRNPLRLVLHGATIPIDVGNVEKPLPSTVGDSQATRERSTSPRSFAETPYALSLEFGLGGPFSGVIEAEKGTVITARYTDGTTKSESPSHVAIQGGIALERTILGGATWKLALRGALIYTNISQQISLGGSGYEGKQWNAQLTRAKAGLFGPIGYLGKRAFGSYQLLIGPMSGTLRPFAVVKELDETQSSDVGYGGWMLRTGPGVGYAFGTFHLGADLLYYLMHVNLASKVYSTLSQETKYQAISFNSYVGVHF